MKNKTNAREHFPKGELTLDKKVVLWNENEKNLFESNSHQNGLEAICYDKSAWIYLLMRLSVWESSRC